MKYLLLIYNSAEQQSTGAEQAELIRGHAALHRELTESGVLASAASLAGPTEATTVRVRRGTPAVTDGPFLEAKEHLAGYYLVDCSAERAAEIAARIPCGVAGAVEVRPIDEVITAAVSGGTG